MELRAGYKQTEVGVIPEDWDLKPLGELATVTAGGTPSRAVDAYWNGDVPWITTSEVDFCTIDGAEQFITREGLASSAARLLPFGTLLIALYGQGKTRGKVAILGIEAATNQACAGVALAEDISRVFAFHFLMSRYKEIRKLSNTGNQENLNSSLVRSILFPLPTLAEQEAIAGALSDADALIVSLERLIAKKRAIKQGAMQELLTGKRRLPGFKGKWEEKSIDDISIVGRGRVISHREIGRSSNPQYPVYSSQTSNSGIMGYLDSFMFEGDYITWTTDGANAGTVFCRRGRFNCTNVCGTIKLMSDNHYFVSCALSAVARSSSSPYACSRACSADWSWRCWSRLTRLAS